MDASASTPVTAAGCTQTTLVADARATRRARRVVYESCLRSKVASELADDAMGVVAELVADLVAQTAGPLVLEVRAAPDEVALLVRDDAGHESTAHVPDGASDRGGLGSRPAEVPTAGGRSRVEIGMDGPADHAPGGRG